MRLHFIQHVPFERPAGIGEWAADNGIESTVTKIYRPPRTARTELPSTDDFDGLVVLGGPMGVDDTEEYPWLSEEVSLISAAIRARRKVLGICLGAQLIAKALGSPVRRARFTEMGWFPVNQVEHTNDQAKGVRQVLPQQFPAFHWHSDSFEIPDTATVILESEACQYQAFVLADTALALQFHLEMGEENIEALLENCGSELGTGRYEQAPDQIRAGVEEHGSLSRALLERLLDWFFLEKTESGEGGESDGG